MIETTAPKTLAPAHAKTQGAISGPAGTAQRPDPTTGDFATLFATLTSDELASFAADSNSSTTGSAGTSPGPSTETETVPAVPISSDVNAWLIASLATTDRPTRASPGEGTAPSALVPQADPTTTSGWVANPAQTMVSGGGTDQVDERVAGRADGATPAAPVTLSAPSAPAQAGHDARPIGQDSRSWAVAGDDAEPRAGSNALAPEHIRAFAYRVEPSDRRSDEHLATPTFHADLNPTLPILPATGVSVAPATSSTPVVSVLMSSPWPSAAFPEELAKQAVWMATNDIQRADLVLNPAELGRIEISLTHENGQMNAHFASHNPEVRATLEEALPRLREQMASAGLQLGHAGVGTQTPGRQDGSQERADTRMPGATTAADGAERGGGALTPPARLHRGLIDLFA